MLSQEGIKFDPSITYMLANDHNYEEEKIVNGGEAGEEAGRFDENEERERRNKSKEISKDRDTFFFFNMRAVAKKMIPPGCAYNDSEDSDE